MYPAQNLPFGDGGRVMFARSWGARSIAVGLAHEGQIKNIVNFDNTTLYISFFDYSRLHSFPVFSQFQTELADFSIEFVDLLVAGYHLVF